MGPKSYFTREEEKELVDFLVNCSKMGYGKTRAEVLRIVEAVMKKKGRLLGDHHISQGWWCRFRERWPEISLRRGDSFSMAQEKMTSREVFENYFDLLQETLDKYNLMDKPSQIYNCDESGMPWNIRVWQTSELSEEVLSKMSESCLIRQPEHQA